MQRIVRMCDALLDRSLNDAKKVIGRDYSFSGQLAALWKYSETQKTRILAYSRIYFLSVSFDSASPHPIVDVVVNDEIQFIIGEGHSTAPNISCHDGKDYLGHTHSMKSDSISQRSFS